MKRSFTRAAGAMVAMGFVALLGLQAAHAAYPPGGAPGTPVITVGGTETITFTGLSPDTLYHIVVHSNPIDLGTHLSDGAGNLTVSFSTAGLDAGSHSVSATAPNGTTVSVGFTVAAASSTVAATPEEPASSTSSGGLAFTGARVGGLTAAALALFATGFAALRLGQRRRRA